MTAQANWKRVMPLGTSRSSWKAARRCERFRKGQRRLVCERRLNPSANYWPERAAGKSSLPAESAAVCCEECEISIAPSLYAYMRSEKQFVKREAIELVFTICIWKYVCATRTVTRLVSGGRLRSALLLLCVFSRICSLRYWALCWTLTPHRQGVQQRPFLLYFFVPWAAGTLLLEKKKSS